MTNNFERSSPVEDEHKLYDIPSWVNAKHVKQKAEDGTEYYDIDVGCAPKPNRESHLDEVLGATPEQVEAKTMEAIKVLDGLYDYFRGVSNVWLQDDGVQRFPKPRDWYDAAARATMAGIIAAREIIHVAGAYRHGNAPSSDAGGQYSFSQANGNAQAAFSKAWQELGLPKLE